MVSDEDRYNINFFENGSGNEIYDDGYSDSFTWQNRGSNYDSRNQSYTLTLDGESITLSVNFSHRLEF